MTRRTLGGGIEVGMRPARDLRGASVIAFVLLAACAEAPELMATRTTSPVTVLTLMVDAVTPATNTLGGVGNPDRDAEWQELADAAELMIRAFRQIKEGGTGPNDMGWAADPRWQAYSDAVIATAEEARRAIEQRDLDALREANDDLYVPCASCHLVFHPTIGPEEP